MQPPNPHTPILGACSLPWNYGPTTIRWPWPWRYVLYVPCMFMNVNCAMAPLPFLEDPPVLALSQCVSQARFCTRRHDTPRGRVIGATPSTCGLNYISLLSLSEEDGDTLTTCMWDRSCIGAGKAVNLGMVTLSRIGWVCVCTPTPTEDRLHIARLVCVSAHLTRSTAHIMRRIDI